MREGKGEREEEEEGEEEREAETCLPLRKNSRKKVGGACLL